jgi:hypothetical protein
MNTAPLDPNGGGFYNASTQAANLAQAANTPGSGWHEATLDQAQAAANNGDLVVIAWSNPNGGSGHSTTVAPNDDNPRAATNPTVAQVGGRTGDGEMPFRNAFGRDERDQVRFYVYTGH